MRLTRVFVRFYKSFNFDYERRARASAQRLGWEMLPEGWYPYVRLDLDPRITAVVGANESGKTHLLDAVECALGERVVARSDFCRHSQLYSVESGLVRVPDVGVEFEVESPEDSAALEGIGRAAPQGARLTLLRPGGTPAGLVGDDGDLVELADADLAAVVGVLPRPVRLSTSVAIPDSISISALYGAEPGRLHDRARRSRFLDLIDTLGPGPEDLAAGAPSLAELLEPTEAEPVGEHSAHELARKLLIDVAKIDPSVFRDLQKAITSGSEGEAKGIEARINQNLSRNLNLRRWWTQDEDFDLRIQARERELAFTIRDRTGTDYSFQERSRGLTHFLAYYVQLRSRQKRGTRPEILLMDEPDAYLSNAGQQDLLKVLENYAQPENQDRFDQVLYVTHSPYLINRNAAHRVRVLDKGGQEEGTRVVKDVARTHYEPLRSALGPHVAETVFIGGTNLIVEGVADQVLLAGISNALRRHAAAAPSCLLDLNEVTIIPAGSADSVPYIAYLARGRDAVKPACVALLDGDQAGRDAEKKLLRAEANRKRILDQRYIVRIDRWAAGLQGGEAHDDPARGDEARGQMSSATEIEDLIPTRVAVIAARAYVATLIGIDSSALENLKESDLKKVLESSGRGLWEELKALVAAKFDGVTIDKVGFARHVVTVVHDGMGQQPRPAGVPRLVERVSALLTHLNEKLSEAAAEEYERRRHSTMERKVHRFLDDHPDGATRSSVEEVLRGVEGALADITEHDVFRDEITKVRRDFSLKQDPNARIDHFGGLQERLRNLLLVGRLAHQDADAEETARS